MIEVFSSGGGTQSCAIAALIIQGKLPKPDFSVIVDTEREQSAVWRYHHKHIEPGLRSIGVEIFRVPKSKYAAVDLFSGKEKDTLTIPAFTSQSGLPGKLSTFCSNEWKSRVCDRFLSKEQRVNLSDCRKWIGFSLDESTRAVRMMRGEEWKNGRIRFPLINDAPMRRHKSIKLALEMFGEEPPRSACWMCPNKSDAEWIHAKIHQPEEFKMACELEKEVQKIDPFAWLHGSCVPLGEVDFSKPQDVFERACDSGNCFI